jgi:DNA-binding CsgD family transcriptional regulator/tetratricopeptide (TPR) repeat protein
VADAVTPASLDGVWPLVGRDEILARVRTALAVPTSRMVVLTGEPGVGKSRIATAAAESVAESGALVIAIHGHPILSAVPLGVAGPLLPPGATADDPVALFAAVRAHLTELADSRRIVLQADSAAILDPTTTGLVAQLTAARAVTLLATIRNGDPLPDALAAQWSPDDCTRVDVPSLTPAQAGDVLQAALGGPVAWHVADELHAASGGSPLYLRELVLGAVASQRLALVAGTWQLTGDPVPTPALRELVLAHVRRLDDAERDVVERLAVCGELPVRTLAGPGAADALERLEGIDVVAIEPRTLTARLTQPLYGTVVRDGLTVLRVAAIAREQADLLEADGGQQDALRLALWRLDAGVPVSADTLLAAAETAAATHDHRTVERLTSGVELIDPRLLLVRGASLARLGRVTEALTALRAAARLAADGDPALVLRIATTTAFAAAIQADGIPAALDALDGLPESLRGDPDVVYMRASLLLSAHRAAEARELFDGLAAELAGSSTGRTLHARALASTLSALGDDEAALASARLALEIAEGPAVPRSTLEATLAQVLLQAGRFDEAFDAGIRDLRLASAGDDQFGIRGAELALGRIELERGRLESAARWFREVVGGALARGPMSLAAPAAGGLALVRLSQGDADGADEALGLVPAGAPARVPTTVLAAGVSAARLGDLALAVTTLGGAAHELAEQGHRFHAGVHLFTLARWGDPGVAATGLERLVAAGAGELTALQARHARAEADGDGATLVAVADDWIGRGAVLYAAEALASAARLAHAAGEPRTATGLQARSDALAAQSQGAATPLLRFTATLVPLTAREREIAALAAQGESSKDIAERLFLSVRTVDNHLQSIYGKLGIRGRRELAAAIG